MYPMLKLGIPIDGVKREWEVMCDEKKLTRNRPKVSQGVMSANERLKKETYVSDVETWYAY